MNLNNISYKELNSIYMYLNYDYDGKYKKNTRKYLFRILNLRLKKYDSNMKLHDNCKSLKKYKRKVR